MNNSAQHPNKPSAKFLRTLREMAEERGVTFEPPATTAEARRQFEILKAIPREDRGERRRELAAIRRELASGTCGARVRPEELGGFGSDARWRGP